MPWLDVDLEDEDGVALQKGKYLRTDKRDIDIAVVQIPHISNFTDFNALAAQPDVRVRYVRQPEELAGADLVILPGSKNTLGDLVWLRESGMAHGVVQLHRNNVPVVGICGGYQMLGDTIIDEVESGLGTLPGLGLLNTVTHFAQHKTTTLVEGQMSSSLGLFDSDDFTRALVNGLRERKGLAPLDSTFHYAQYKSQQFDLLADAMRQHIDIEKIYTIMQQHREPV
ncbi:cobyric acid synthase CobQ, partial [Citrobacter freundii]